MTRKMRHLLNHGGIPGVLIVGTYLLFRSKIARLAGLFTVAAISPFLFRSTGCVPTKPHAYRITDLGTLPGSTESFATGINDQGQVVGRSGLRGKNSHPFVWKQGKMQELPLISGNSKGSAASINNKGQIVGWSGSLSGKTSPVLWNPGTRKPFDLGALPGQNSGEARDINNRGEIVGHSFHYEEDGDLNNSAFLWSKESGMRDLGPLGDDVTNATSISDSGHIVGVAWSYWYTFANGFIRAPTEDSLTTLKRLTGGKWIVQSEAVNRSGQIVGFSDASEQRYSSHACLWLRPDKVVDLGTIGGRKTDISAALDINDSGLIVGWCTVPGQDRSQTCAVLWRNRQIYNLNDLAPKDSGWTLSTASAVNNRDWIVGTGIINGKLHAYLLIPSP